MLNIGGSDIPCSVLSDGTRLLTQEGFLSALGRSAKPKGRSNRSPTVSRLFWQQRALKSLISKEIIDTTVPVVFVLPNGRKAHGYKAELLPKVCDLFLQARSLGTFPHHTATSHCRKSGNACEGISQGWHCRACR